MTEIKLTLEGQTNPKWLANNLRSRAKYMAEEVGASNTAAALREVACQIEKQAEPPVVAARDAYSDQMNLELRQSIAANVLEAMDVDQYLIDAVRNATPPPPEPGLEYSDLEYAARLDGSTMPAPRVLPNEFCWCGGDVGARVPGDHLGLGCLLDITHNWNAASAESQQIIEREWSAPASTAPDPSADEWARLDAASSYEVARARITEVLKVLPFRDNAERLTFGPIGLIADALITAGLIRDTPGDMPMLSGEDLRVASEKVDEWVREGDQAAPAARWERVAQTIDAHYYDASWSKAHQGFRCVCGWLGDSHVQHVTDMLAAGVFRDEATVKAEALREAAATARLAAANSFTRNGRYENESIADWLDDQADAIDPTRTEGAHP